MFPSEYIINFRVIDSIPEQSIFVNKSDVKLIDREKGLVKLRGYSKPEDGKVLVGINDVGDCTLSNFVVYLEDIIRE